MNTPQELEKVETQEQSLELPRYPLLLLLVPAVAILGELISALLSRADQINYDCAYYLLCAGLLADGQRPMTDFIDLLPPIIYYLSLPSVWLAHLTHLPVSNCFTIITFACVCLSVLASIIVMRRVRDVEPIDWLSLGPLLTGFLLFNLIVGFHFGQREHIFVLSLFPFFLIRWLRVNALHPPLINNYLAAACGMACGVAVYVKPQLIIIPLAIELSMLRLSKNRGAKIFLEQENLYLAGALLFCFLISFLIPGIDVYYQRWVPFVSKAYAAFFAPTTAIMLLFVSPDGHMVGSRVFVLILCLVAYMVRRSSALISPLIAWTLSGFLVYVLQGRGWSYQSIPFVLGYVLLFCVVVANFIGRAIVFIEKRKIANGVLIDRVDGRLPTLMSRRLVRSASVIFLLFAAIASATSFLLVRDSMGAGKILPTLDSTIIENTKPKDTIVILHTLFPHAHQMQLQLDRRPGCRYIWCFPVRMAEFLKGNPSFKNQGREAENLVINEIKGDIRRTKPKLIMVEAWADGSGFSLYKTLLAHGFLNLVSADYEPLLGANGFAVYKRKETDYSQDARDRQNQ